MREIIHKYSSILIAVVITASLSFFGGYATKKGKTNNNTVSYQYLAPRLFGEETNDLIINFTQLREVMKNRFSEKKLNLGIYFEYLPTGSSIGVNDQMEVEIGSLGKVPAVMAVYKNIEEGKLTLDTQLTLKEQDLDKQFGTLWQKGVGTKLSVADAIHLALIDSDNTAINAILDKINQETQDAVFDELDLPKETDGLYPIMSPKSYASVFRNLYLSSYLMDQHSNDILELLTKTNFTDKIPAGLPLSVKTAHKIGVFAQSNGNNIYNDCGIIYVPERPYILCIMASADENTARTEMIAYSKMVYSYVSQISPPTKVKSN